MSKSGWFNTVVLGLIGLSQVPAFVASLGGYAWILGAVASAANIYLHEKAPPAA